MELVFYYDLVMSLVNTNVCLSTNLISQTMEVKQVSFCISMFFAFVFENAVVDGSLSPCIPFGNEDIVLVN